MLTIPIGIHSKQILTGSLDFQLVGGPSALPTSPLGNPSRAQWGKAGQDRGSTGLRRFLLLNQVAPGTPESPGGDRPCQLASPLQVLPSTFLLVRNKCHTASLPGGPDLQSHHAGPSRSPLDCLSHTAASTFKGKVRHQIRR